MLDRKYLVLIVISVTLISLVLVVAGDTFLIYAEDSIKYKVKLLGSSVVPPVNTTAAGRGFIFIGNDWLGFKLNLTGISDPTMAHLHMAKKGANGTNATIVADLFNKQAEIENTDNRITIKGKIGASELLGPMKDKTMADLKSAINNETLQIDLHTKKYPDGELRGTIRMPGGNTTQQIAVNANTTLSS